MNTPGRETFRASGVELSTVRSTPISAPVDTTISAIADISIPFARCARTGQPQFLGRDTYTHFPIPKANRSDILPTVDDGSFPRPPMGGPLGYFWFPVRRSGGGASIRYSLITHWQLTESFNYSSPLIRYSLFSTYGNALRNRAVWLGSSVTGSHFAMCPSAGVALFGVETVAIVIVSSL